MRTPRIFLGVFALALILLLLLLACDGSDEPTERPASERATAAPTPKATAALTPTATAAPTPRATAAQTALETDREALVALHNATGRPNWSSNNNWLSDVPIGQWEGVTTEDNGRVTELNLQFDQLSGEIPPELGNLANLEWLDLNRNQLSGCVPSSLLAQLDMSNSNLGDLPFCP